MNINTKKYWNQRFASGNWKETGGVEETMIFAESQIPRLKLSKEFSGIILDFGCALGHAPSFLSTLYNIYFKNIFRRLISIQTLRPVLQIMYVFKNHN